MYPTHLWITLFAILLSACNSGLASTAPPLASPTSRIIAENHPTLIITPIPAMNTKTSPVDSSNLDPATTRLVEKTREHLTKKFGIPSDQITVFSIQEVIWPDASLGCPQQGINYIQVETPGYLILMEAAGQTYNYHTDKNETVALCDVQAPGEIFLPPDP